MIYQSEQSSKTYFIIYINPKLDFINYILLCYNFHLFHHENLYYYGIDVKKMCLKLLGKFY